VLATHQRQLVLNERMGDHMDFAGHGVALYSISADLVAAPGWTQGPRRG
jgi:hypothetical protein